MSYLPDNGTVQSLLRAVAKRIIDDTTYRLTDTISGEEYCSVDTLKVKKSICLKSGYEDWKYWNGVIVIAFKKLYEVTNILDYKTYIQKNFRFISEVIPYFKEQYKWFEPEQYSPNYHQFFRMDRLDDCGAMSASIIEAFDWLEKDEWSRYIERTANYISHVQDRLEDGTFCREFNGYATLWADDVYMSVPFLVRMGQFSGDKKYWDDAVNNTLNFHDKLFNKDRGLYYHSYCEQVGCHGVAHWGRANGWSVLAKCDLLETIPQDYPGWSEVRKSLFEQIVGFSRYQAENGMWRQLLDKTDSFYETSVTAMFTYAAAKSINMGWIPDIYSSIAIRGWEGIIGNIRPDGQVENISEGFNIRQDLTYYYNRACPLNDPHGLGAVLLAGIEIYKMKNYLDAIWE